MAATNAITSRTTATTWASPGRPSQTLEAKGVDLIIGVTHLHMWKDVELAGLKAKHPKLAFIVGGHEHEPEHSPGSDTSADCHERRVQCAGRLGD